MLRKLILSALMLPLLLNGLWIVCNDSSGEDQGLPDASSGLTQEQIDCIRICAMKHRLGDGTICLVLPGDAKASISIVDFGVAILPAQIKLDPIAVAENFST